MKFEIAIELLEAERERLLRDHYETLAPKAKTPTSSWYLASYDNCDGCARAYAVKQELDALKEVAP